MQPPDAVCFDLDDTLCTSTQDPDALLETAFDRVGSEHFCEYDQLQPIVPDLPAAETDHEFHTNLFSAAARRYGGDPDLATDLATAYLDAYDPSAVRFRDGAERALETARERGPIALVTNGGRQTQTAKLETLGIADAFDAAVFTDPAAGIEPKPSATPFEMALAELGTDPDRTLHIGDSLRADVAGANAMGMTSTWLADGRTNDTGHEPHHTVDTLSAFESLF